MYRQRRDFLLLMTLAAAAAMPALGQTPAPAVGPASSGMQSAASRIDFRFFDCLPSNMRSCLKKSAQLNTHYAPISDRPTMTAAVGG
jgi:hypothetical protein